MFGYSNAIAFAGVGFVAAITVALRKPVLSIVLGFLFFPPETWIALIVGTAVALAFIKRAAQYRTRTIPCSPWLAEVSE